MRPRLAASVFGAALLVLVLAIYWWATSVKKPQRDTADVPTHATPAAQTGTPEATRPGTQPQATSPPTPAQPRANQEQAFLGALLKPIVFWGKVVDQSGNPVGGATVDWSTNNNPNPYGSGSKGRTESDASGLFSVTSHGIGLYAKVSKDGYGQIPTELRGARGSSGGFSNAANLGNTDSPMGTRSDPAVFVLRKKGEAAELTYVTDRPVKVPKNGAPVEIALETGQAVPAGKGSLRIECWTEDQKKDAQGNYPWRCRVSVPGGGLLKRESEYDFEAPAEGYQPNDDITPPEERWSAKAERHYFVKMADGHFARVNLRMRTGGEHFVVIESYFNPQPGSRNLEYDPAKQASAR